MGTTGGWRHRGDGHSFEGAFQGQPYQEMVGRSTA